MTGGLIMVWITSRYIDFYSEISNRIPRPRQVCSLIYTHLGNAHEPQRFSPVLTGRSIWSIGFFSSGNITLIIRGILISFSRTFWRNRPIYKYLHVQSWELELIHALQAAILQDSWQFQAFPRLCLDDYQEYVQYPTLLLIGFSPLCLEYISMVSIFTKDWSFITHKYPLGLVRLQRSY